MLPITLKRTSVTDRMQGRRVLVIGANRGIGAAIATGLAAQGAVVACGSRRVEDAEATCERLRTAGATAHAVQTDLLDHEVLLDGIDDAVRLLGGIDCLVQSGGITATTPALDIEFDEWRRVLGTNLDGSFLAAQAVARHQRDAGIPGSIILVTSQLSQVAIPNKAHYLASKGALTMLVKAMSIELAPHGIRVNALAPGVTATDMAMSRLEEDEEAMRWTLDRIPLGRLGEPEEMVGAATFLASDESAYVTGTTLVVDGGYLAR